MNTDLLGQFGQLALEEKALKVKMDEVKAKKAAIADAAKAELMLAGLINAPLEIGITVFLETKLWAKACRLLGPDGLPLLDENKKEKPDWPTSCAALKHEGLGEYVGETFHTGALSSYFRKERENIAEAEQLPHAHAVDLDRLLPPRLRGAIILSDVETLKAVRN